ncbi:DgyrCDS9039 [Dimorphilus gyrociliatus]|uniref:DgyrCDS9039 n=1 Tax=Dimorphilus gyrociliatus TaxID=2664684 RepID=A0A7I8VVX0_9ANNE|nr:DgyrCDS9039 [Dimorphilus gyrociliatus]
MADLTDAELRLELIKYGYTPGPIVPSTRKVLEKKLQKLKSGKLNSNALVTVSTDENDSDAPSKSTPKSNRRKKSPIKSSSTKQASVTSTQLLDEDDLDTNSVGLQCSFNEGIERPLITGRRPLGANSPFTKPKFYSSTPKCDAPSLSSYSTYRKFSSVTLRSGDTTKTLLKTEERKSSSDDNSSWRPQNVSALIILFFGAFLSVIVYLYLNQRLLGMERAHVQAICNKDGPKSSLCSLQPERVKSTQQIAKAIYDVLNTGEGNRICKDESLSLYMPQATVIKQISVILRREVTSNEQKFAYNLISENPEWHMRLYDSSKRETSLPESVQYLRCIKPSLPLSCRISRSFKRLALYILTGIAGVLMIISLFVFRKYWKKRAERRMHEMYLIIDNIINFFESESRQKRDDGEEDVFFPIDHVRDRLIEPKKRRQLEKLWTEAINFLSDNESRLSEQIRVVNGEEFRVWKWNDGALNGKNKVWQGKAVSDNCKGDDPVIGYYECLKIRNMFDPDTEVEENWHVAIEDAILEQCKESDIVHISVEKSSKEGCVYVKCRTKLDAGKAFKQMRGLWFNRRLISVKYLSLERYHRRFPKAVSCCERLEPSNDERRSLAVPFFNSVTEKF